METDVGVGTAAADFHTVGEKAVVAVVVVAAAVVGTAVAAAHT